jgi:hypothetical protein
MSKVHETEVWQEKDYAVAELLADAACNWERDNPRGRVVEVKFAYASPREGTGRWVGLELVTEDR